MFFSGCWGRCSSAPLPKSLPAASATAPSPGLSTRSTSCWTGPRPDPPSNPSCWRSTTGPTATEPATTTQNFSTTFFPPCSWISPRGKMWHFCDNIWGHMFYIPAFENRLLSLFSRFFPFRSQAKLEGFHNICLVLLHLHELLELTQKWVRQCLFPVCIVQEVLQQAFTYCWPVVKNILQIVSETYCPSLSYAFRMMCEYGHFESLAICKMWSWHLLKCIPIWCDFLGWTLNIKLLVHLRSLSKHVCWKIGPIICRPWMTS